MIKTKFRILISFGNEEPKEVEVLTDDIIVISKIKKYLEEGNLPEVFFPDLEVKNE